MRVSRADIPDVAVIETGRAEDERGFFARLVCAPGLEAVGLPFRPVQISRSFNARAGTLRGLHFQRPPHAETKLVQALRGAVWDVAVDLRPGSPTLGRWCAVELTGDNGRAVLIPPGFAHGFVTLTDEAELLYATDAPWTPGAEGGARWDDPAFAIDWPRAPAVMSDRDAAWAPFCGVSTPCPSPSSSALPPADRLAVAAS